MKYFYYSLYKFILLTPSKNEHPEHIANLILALIFQLTILGILNILEYFDIQPIYDFGKNKIAFVGIYLLFLVVGYLAFIKNKNYLSIKQRFDTQTKSKKIVRFGFVILYMIFLIFALFVI